MKITTPAVGATAASTRGCEATSVSTARRGSRCRLAELARRAVAAFALLASVSAHANQTVNGITINEDLDQARRGVAYNYTVPVISGGAAPYTFSLIGPSVLPIRLVLATNGNLSGVISCNVANGNYKQDVRVTDSSAVPIVADFTSNKGLAINVTAGPAGTCVALTLAPASLPTPTAGSAYSQTITASGGLAPYTYTVSAGTLPAGLSLNSTTGQISGTPTTGGAYSFTISAIDAADSTGTVSYSGTVNPAVVVNPATLPGGTVGTAYNQTVSASGGNGAFTLSLTAGALPAGLSFNAATGVISGTPSASGTSNFTISATDGNGATGSRAYGVTINLAVTVGPSSLPDGAVASAYSQTIVASGGTGSFTYAVTAGSLPAGLALNPATGALTGTPTTAASSSFTIRATDGNGATGSRSYTVTVNPAIVVNPASLPAGTVGSAYNQAVSASGGNGAFTYSVSAGALPAGLSLNPANGAVSGTPSSPGAASFTITATDGNGSAGSRAYSVTINAAVVVNPASLPGGTVGVAYSQSVTATGGTGSYTYSVSAGVLPAGLSLNPANGAIAGTPSSAGTASFAITATDGNGAMGSRAYSVTINAAVAVNPASLPGGTVGVAYSQSVSATGGTGTYTFTVTAGLLPAGLTLSAATGALTGIPTSAGTSGFTITATDGNGATGSRAYSVTINAAVVVNPATLPGGSVGVAYSQTVTATGGSGSYTFSVTAGALPTGLALNTASGAITGTPSSAGAASFTITATDGNGATGSRAYGVTINAAVTVNPASLPGGTVGVPYSQTVTATGGTGSYTFSVSAGALPTGLSLNIASGAISGTPSSAGAASFTITATDGNGATGSRAYSVTVNAAVVVNPALLPAGTVGVVYSQSVSATGGTGTYTFSVSAGALPTGLTLNPASGAISGTPSSAGTSNFTVTATDGNGATGSRAYMVTINAGIAVNPASLPGGTVGVAYSQTITATGGTGSYTFSVTAGSLPTGVTLNALTGALTGTPSNSGTSSFTITATDGNGATGARAYSVTINSAITVNPASLPGGTVGVLYNQAVTATGGTGSYTYGVSAGSLPAGLSLNTASGAISGSPTTAGAASFTITATDSNGATGSRAYSVAINAAVAVNPASLPGGTVGVTYSQSISATGGTGSYTFSVSAGALPAGLSLNPASGAITGTPTSAGAANFTITATDGNGAAGSRAYNVTISAAISVNPTTLPAATVGTPYSQTVTATGGSGSYTYSLSAGSLPAGLALNAATGAVTGTPTSAATSSFTITATDGNGASGLRAYSVTVNPAITVNPSSLPAGTVNTAYSQSVSATGGNGSYTFSVSAGMLPIGLALNSATGLISGTPTAAATSAFTIRALDTSGASGTRAYSVTINAGMTVGPATLPAAAVGSAYSQTVVAAGGTGAYTYGVVGSLPVGLTLNASTGVLSGTPTSAGASSFTVTATDGNGATASRAYVFTVNPALALNPLSLPNGAAGAAYSQTMAASGGNGSYTYSVSAGALPAGLTLNATTGLLSGTPSAAAAGSFTITATDGAGATVSRAYSVTINSAIVVNPATVAGGTVGSPYSQTIIATGGSGTFTYSVSSGSLPAGLALNATTGVISGMPTTAGTSTFTLMSTDGAGVTGGRTYTVVVVAATLTLESTTLGNGIVGSPYTQSIVVSGGVAPYVFSIASGQLPTGVALNPASGTFYGTPTVPGTYAFSVRIVDANGASGLFAQAIVVEPRADPTQDPTVRGILASQLSAASRFGSAQIQNVGQRVRMLHFGQDPCSFSFDVGANIQWERSDASSNEPTGTQGAKSAKSDEIKDEKKRCDSPFAVWAGGNIDFGFLRPSTATDRSDFTTSGLTLGADTRVIPGLVLGGALGYGRDTSDVGSSGSDSRAQAVNATFYGSYQPLKSLYIDFALGYGSLSFDSIRWQNTTLMLGGRDGSQTYGSLGVSGVLAFASLQFAPYGRFDRVRSRLGGYVESGPANMALNYGEVTAIEDVIAAGFYTTYRIPLGRASLEPSLRLEARRVHMSSVDQTLTYADLPAYGYVLTEGSASDTQALGGLGLVLRMANEFSLGIEYSYTGNSETYRNESVRAIVRAPF